MKNKSNTDFIKTLGDFFARYNLIIFLIIITVGLSISVLALSNIIKNTYDEKNYKEDTASTKFDESTISELNEFYRSDNNPNINQTVTGRNNLFSE